MQQLIVAGGYLPSRDGSHVFMCATVIFLHPLKTKQTKKTRSNLFKGNVLQSNTSIISRFTPAKASRQTFYALNDDEIILNIIRLQARCLALI